MKLTLRTDLTVEDLCKGFVYNEVEGKGLYGWEGRLTIQPEYQRNYIYGDGRRGVFEYVLGGERDTRLLNVRIFDERTKKAVYAKQTAAAERKGVSNCPLCAIGHDAQTHRIWKLGEMDADHVAAWSKGGATDAANCQMLCKTHNRAKGNR